MNDQQHIARCAYAVARCAYAALKRFTLQYHFKTARLYLSNGCIHRKTADIMIAMTALRYPVQHAGYDTRHAVE